MQPGVAVGPYRIDRELGSGGMGTVYAATVAPCGADGALPPGTRVALKVVHAHLLESGDAVERFRREVTIGRSVEHPNVVRTYDGGEADGRHYLAMEYVEGQTLHALLEELERVPEELCRHIGRELCKGLGAIHAAGAIHRDLKPENVMITPQHVVKIMDLGVARSTDDALRLSQTGAFVGSLHYAAPEQFTGGGKGLDHRVDLHALGLVLYELACGTNPYLADDIPQVIRKVLHEEPRRLGELNPQLTAFYEEVVHCLLAKDRDRRFGTADELAAALERGEDGTWWDARARALQLASRRPLRRARIPRETAVYGREEELTRLRALFERAAAGDGQVVFVEGEAGIGKSRLIDELIGRLQQEGADINYLFGGYPPGGAATVDGGFSAAYREQLGADGSAAYLSGNRILVPAFDALLRGELPPPGAQALDKSSLQTCFVRTTQALAAERTTVVLIDDLHFAPEEGRALFTSLAMAVPGHAVLLIGTARPGVSDEWRADLGRLDQTTQLALHRLGPKDLVRLLRDTLQSEQLARDLGDRIAVKSDGNPFFVFEILRGLREGLFLTQRDDGSWVSTGVIDDIRIPSSVLDLVKARVAGLSDEERDLLDVACCSGYRFDPGLVGDVLGMGRIPVLKRFGQIERKHRLVRAAGRHMVFDHHQVQEALYESLLPQLREEYHAALADALETRTDAAAADVDTLDGALCVELCEQFLRGARGASALRYLAAAHGHLANGHLHARAIELTERALAVPGLLTGAARATTLLRLADSLDMLGRVARQEECAREAERLADAADDDALRMHAAMALGRVYWRSGRLDEAEPAYLRARQLAVARADRRQEALVARGLGMVAQNLSRHAEGLEHHARHLALSREIGDREGEAAALVNMGLAFRQQFRLDEAQEHLERGIGLSREIGYRFGESMGEMNLAQVLQLQGRVVEAPQHTQRGLAIVRELGARPSEAVGLLGLGTQRYGVGDLRGARPYLDAALALCRETGARYPEGYTLLFLGVVADAAGDVAEALTFAEQSLAVRRQTGHAAGVAEALVLLGELRARSGDVEGARAALADAAARLRELGIKGQEVRALAGLAWVSGGDPEAIATAEAALAEAGSTADGPVPRLALWQATGDRAHLERGRQLVLESLARAPAECREAMLTNIRENRELMAAWEAYGAPTTDGV